MSVEELLHRHRGLVRNLARQYRTDQWSTEELMQEANIALWRASQSRPGDNLDKLASYVIKRRILEVVTSGATLAHRESGGAGRRFEVQAEVWIDALDPPTRDILDGMMPTTPSAETESVQNLTLREVREFLGNLEDWKIREVGLGRLDGRLDRDTAKVIGSTQKGVQGMWSRKLLPALREAMA